MYKGTHDGDIDEIKFVVKFNSNKSKFDNYLKRFEAYSNLWMVRVTSKQLSKLSDRKVFTRSDTYLVSINSDISKLLEDNDYYLSEDILLESNIPYTKIPHSGVSVKMTTSKSYQILKIGPNSFKGLFYSYELGAGASLYCLRENELPKNPDLITGWNSTVERMATYFDRFTNSNKKFYLNQEICKNIKNYSCKEIERMINSSDCLQKKIFNGIGLYEEPYTAFYFYHGESIHELTNIPFNVTTGSGRSKGDYTIVLKPN